MEINGVVLGGTNGTRCSLSHPLDGPLLLAQRTAIVLLHPQRHAAVVERVVAFAPDDHAVLAAERVLLAFGLAAQAGICEVE